MYWEKCSVTTEKQWHKSSDSETVVIVVVRRIFLITLAKGGKKRHVINALLFFSLEVRQDYSCYTNVASLFVFTDFSLQRYDFNYFDQTALGPYLSGTECWKTSTGKKKKNQHPFKGEDIWGIHLLSMPHALACKGRAPAVFLMVNKGYLGKSDFLFLHGQLHCCIAS